MENKYKITKLIICPLIKVKGRIKSEIDYFSESRLCVLDKDNNCAVDVDLGLKYDYIRIVNGIYYEKSDIDKIEDNKRYAIYDDYFNVDSADNIELAYKVIENLKSGYEYPDGNDVLSNIDYYNLLEKEKIKSRKLIKRFRRKK